MHHCVSLSVSALLERSTLLSGLQTYVTATSSSDDIYYKTSRNVISEGEKSSKGESSSRECLFRLKRRLYVLERAEQFCGSQNLIYFNYFTFPCFSNNFFLPFSIISFCFGFLFTEVCGEPRKALRGIHFYCQQMIQFFPAALDFLPFDEILFNLFTSLRRY